MGNGKKGGDATIKKWIHDSLAGRTCLVVLVGTETAERSWVRYEFETAWNNGLGILGNYLHNLKAPRSANFGPSYGKCTMGVNPFDYFTMDKDKSLLSAIVKCYDPDPNDAYGEINGNICKWIEEAIQIQDNY
jgi:MTH538 TIR-like domain (DUF1863)